MAITEHQELLYVRTLRDGRVIARNVWATGWQDLVYPTRAAFDRAKTAVERDGEIPEVVGYTPA